MAQLKQDEWPDDRDETTIEQQVERDPVNGPKDPERREKGQAPTVPERTETLD